jgi:transcriptional regulator with XRE-family HTH domain
MRSQKLSIGEKIKALRMRKKMSLREFCALTGVHFTQIIRYEQNKVKPSEVVLQRIADGMNIPVTYFGSDIIKPARVDQKEKLEAMQSIMDILEDMPEPFVLKIKDSIQKAKEKIQSIAR